MNVITHRDKASNPIYYKGQMIDNAINNRPLQDARQTSEALKAQLVSLSLEIEVSLLADLLT